MSPDRLLGRRGAEVRVVERHVVDEHVEMQPLPVSGGVADLAHRRRTPHEAVVEGDDAWRCVRALLADLERALVGHASRVRHEAVAQPARSRGLRDEQLGAASTEQSVRRLRDLIARYPKQHACFVMELVQGEGGFNVAPREHLAALMEVCREASIPVWVDEIQTFGRTTQMFAFETLGLGEFIDVATIGKMAQVCACLFTAEINPKPGLLAGTFMASTSAFHVGKRALEIMRDGGYYGHDGKIARLHQAFREHAGDLIRRRPEHFPVVHDAIGRTQRELCGGIGGMMRLTPLGGVKAKIDGLLKVLFDEGVIALSCGHGPYHLRFLPPIAVMEGGQFKEVFAILERSLDRLRAEGTV